MIHQQGALHRPVVRQSNHRRLDLVAWAGTDTGSLLVVVVLLWYLEDQAEDARNIAEAAVVRPWVLAVPS